MSPAFVLGLVVALIVSWNQSGVAPASPSVEDQVWQYRNLGKAFYENPTTQHEAVEQFRKALDLAPASARERLNYGLALLKAGKTDEGVLELEKVQRQDPAIPHTWFNLGIQYKRRNTPEWNERAIAQFEKMIALVPDNAVAHYNLGALYKTVDRGRDALEQFEIAARLEPSLAGPHFQLYNAYRDAQVGRQADADREFAIFRVLKKQQEGAAVPEDLGWSTYSEIFEPGDRPDIVDAPPLTPRFVEREVPAGLGGQHAGLTALDADGDDHPDAIVWSSRGARLLEGGRALSPGAGFEHIGAVRFVAPADFDNDGLTDLAIVQEAGISLWKNVGDRQFVQQPLPVQDRTFTKAVWIDYDHDYDLDLVLLGERSCLLRNSGDAGFTDVTSEFPFAAGSPLDVVSFEASADTLGQDLLVSYADRSAVLYRDRLAGKYVAEDVDAIPAGSATLIAQDVDRDGCMDIVAVTPSSTRLLRNRGGKFAPTPVPSRSSAGMTFTDFENLGVADLISGDDILRWTSSGIREASLGLASAVTRAAADFDGDGQLDVLSVDRAGVVRLALNSAQAPQEWIEVRLTGVKNLKAAIGAKVEVKAGAAYQKQMYRGVPLHFGLGAHDTLDTVRITWANGLVQNETHQRARRHVVFKEAARLSGSCPMIFTWDGSHFRFLTDVLGVAPLGASAGDDKYFPVDHDEYIFVPADALARTDGQYDIRVTEELREVSYIDSIQLLALDHPAPLTIVTNDKFKAPPFPTFRLFGVERAIAPVAARDERGVDVLDRLGAADRRYPDAYRRDFQGVAGMHHLDLDFGGAAPNNRAVLVLTGWVDWADGSTFRGASQGRTGGLVLPYLQVKDAGGRWTTVVDDMGIPAGKPKTIAVDLTGRFLSRSREVRIVTNLCVYWDHIYLSEDVDPPQVAMTPLEMSRADLRFRGFSRPIVDARRVQPEAFEYADVRLTSMWNPTPGFYTRYGDVRALLGTADDRFVILGSGDEVRLLFDPGSLPVLRAGWRRDFLLLFDGYAKDADPNTAFSQTVEPLPFHAMSAYPYGPSERFPRADYAREYNTRPALRILRPLSIDGARR